MSLAGVFGLLGVATAAYSAHGSADARLTSAVALILLAHAPALIALAGHLSRSRIVAVAAILMALGAGLFSCDVMLRAVGQSGLFPYAAPLGGSTLMVAWFTVIIAGFLRPRSS
ncbi:DUF423 domain-containing protein [Notoacmeibacter ruber]|uniref:DUF423 domain-containing protein n=2 Tax=Notoacmeibacter ruber TaxID=2670375 RepID=A0A3L7JFD5_9HYPH|nr:DUF423 domain-containing protein [Notoacmeibacter ruber]